MQRVASFSVVSDAWVVEAIQNTISFDVPSHLDSGSQSVLSFMLDISCSENTSLILRMNGLRVWHWNYSEDTRLVQNYQEVLNPGVLRAGTNVFSFDSSSGDVRFLQLSDIVVWWQANLNLGGTVVGPISSG